MRLRQPATWLALAALAGCVGGTTSPRTHYYTLSVEARAARAESTPAAAGPVNLSVSRVAIPGVVDRPQLVARVAANNVEILDFHRWAEPLQEAIPRVVAGNLARELGSRYLVAAGIVPGVAPQLRVALDVQRFEAVMGTGVTVEALWSVRPAAETARAGRSMIEEPVTEAGHAGIAAAYSRALARVARDIAGAVTAPPLSSTEVTR
jgi:uncharacterized lipoprotein YmbA